MRDDLPVFTRWTDGIAARFGREPLKLDHSLHTLPLFSREGLAELIDAYPRSHYSLVQMGPQGETARRFWREGDKGDLTGAEVIAAIEEGRMWLNMRRVDQVDPRYRDLLTTVFTELEGRVPGLDTFDRTAGILISSPKAQVYYHADLPGQSLWQIIGKKRVFVYPNTAPYLTPRQVEDIAVFEIEVDLPYEAAFDDGAMVFDIGPGEMLHWPLNAPHRVENHDVLNVSMTVEYWTDEIRRSQIVNMANGLLRHRFGVPVTGRSLSGPGFYAKAAFQKIARRGDWLKRVRAQKRPVTFRLERGAPAPRIVELDPIAS